jgi:hypothetical protein
MSDLYDRDFYAWANQQAKALRHATLAELDWQNLAEEIESMGRSEKRELVSRLAVLMSHLLKWRFQPDRQSNSWRLTIREQRLRLNSHLKDNPSLKSKLDEAIAEAYEVALIDVQRETNLPETAFPSTCPWAFDQIMDAAFWPA